MQTGRVALASMRNLQSGTVISIHGGAGMHRRLEALGIRNGAKLIKKSAIMGGGPVIINIGNAELAIGYGMASRIYLEVDE
jgi:ferrous iron transport protein A